MNDKENNDWEELNETSFSGSAAGPNYNYAWAFTLKKLYQVVNSAVKSGYRPTGGITIDEAVIKGKVRKVYLQAIFRD